MGTSSSKQQDLLDSNVINSSSSTDKNSLPTTPTKQINATNNNESSGQCPMKLGNSKSTTSSTGGSCPMKQKTSSSTSNTSKSAQQIQYNVYSQPIDPKNNMPAVANQLPSAGQTDELSVERKRSTIPKGGTDNETWVYPSPQMFYNALARKQKLDDTKESDIPSVVALHNNMNEKTWAKILEWESVLDPPIDNNISSTKSTKTTKLLRFLGRPSDLSPKARFKSLFLSHPLPFDRHDWTVVRPDGTEVRYIIDYYHDESRASELPDSGLPDMEDREAVKSILVDVRPALDSIHELKARCFTMPLARYMGNTNFEPMPMIPTKEMIGQVDESVKVWDNIQKQAKINSANKQKKQVEDNTMQSKQITKEEAVAIAKSFADILKQCSESKQIMESCEKDEEYAQASLALSMCMAKVICPLQHKTVVKALHSEDEEVNSKVHNAKVDTSLENMLMCVAEGNDRVSRAKVKFPDLFQDKI